ncbi:RluA family pseudouridine synthase [Marinomonas agarivorans]|nr:RluA family pseudouridine synthase [Marinomonas agarivorans]
MSDLSNSQTDRPKVQIKTITENHHEQRIDNYLLAILKGVPKSRIYNLLRKGEIRVNKKRVKPNTRLYIGDIVRIAPIVVEEKVSATVPTNLIDLIESRIVHEDNNLIIVNKPSGIAVHGGSGLSFGLIEIIRQLKDKEKSLELVHRLDRDTSGLIMIAKKRSVLKQLHAALREKNNVQKTYQALVFGNWPKRKLQVNMPLLKNELKSGERLVKVHPDGKESLTRFKLLRQFDGYSLIECEPVTGRTHQIRVHTQHAGHSIVGDEKYASTEQNKNAKQLGFKRLCLHASRLELVLGEEKLIVEAPIDEEWRYAMNNNLTDIHG